MTQEIKIFEDPSEEDYIKINQVVYVNLGLKSIKAMLLISTCSYFFAMFFKIFLEIQNQYMENIPLAELSSEEYALSKEDNFLTNFDLYNPVD